MPLPSSVQSIALRFTKGNPPTQLSHTQTIPLESIQVGTNASNSVKVDSTFVAAFNAEQEGTIFTPSIVINYGNNITTATSPASGVPNFVPRPPPPPPIRISRASNNVTIQYTGAAGDVPTSSALFIQANPRGTGNEWFAIVKDGMKQAITEYANGTSSAPFERIPGDNSTLVPFSNIVTTLMMDMSDMFKLTSFNEDISEWDVSSVTNMNNVFDGVLLFNRPLNNWDVSKVESMNSMFLNASVFNQPLNSWDVSAVKNMQSMFFNATAFNQPLNNWDVSKVENMAYMFFNATAFNQPLNNWDVSKVENMAGMFLNASVFNQPLNNWDVSKVENMDVMFQNANVFNQPLNNWDVSKVENMAYMFFNATAFDQDISGWNVSLVTPKPPTNFSSGSALTLANSPRWFPVVLDANGITIKYVGSSSLVPTSSALFIEANPRGTGMEWFAVVKYGMKQAITDYAKGASSTPFERIPGDDSTLVPFNNIVTSLMTDMSYMFYGAIAFNGNISSWDTSLVTTMLVTFYHAREFNGNVSSWNTSKVTNMNQMFVSAYAFNQPLNSWDVSSVTNMNQMFVSAYAFNQPLNSWDVSSVTNMSAMFYQATLFDQNLSGWNVTLTTARPSLNRNDFAFGSPLALPENSNKLPPFE